MSTEQQSTIKTATTDGAGGMGAPASEWSSATLAALNGPTSTTAGFVNADGTAGQVSGAGGRHVGAADTRAAAAAAIDGPGVGDFASQARSAATIAPAASGPGASSATGPSVGDFASHATATNDPTSRVVRATPFAADFNAGMGAEHASGGLQPQAQGTVTGVGLASSPNVPAPGSSTSTPTRAGLTRVQSDALRAAGHDVPTSATSLSGWEQAEAQLRQLGIQGKPEAIIASEGSSARLTPGQEVPGGWGATHAADHPTTTLYQDVSTALDKVGHVAYAAVPQGLKDAIAGHPAEGGQPHSTAPDVLRQAQATAASLAAQAQSAAETAAHRAQQAFEEAKRGVEHNAVAVPLAGGAIVEPGLKPASTTGSHAVAPATSLPTYETVGQLPDEHTSGVGKLPGGAGETGVAVLPDERSGKAHDVGAVTRVGEPSSSSSGLPGYDGELAPPLGVFNAATPLPTQTTEAVPRGVTAAIPERPVAAASEVQPAERSSATAPESASSRTESVSAPVSAPANNRLDSSVSTTAIRDGQPGDLHGSKGMSASSTQTTLPTIGEKDLPSTPAVGAQKSTTPGTGPSTTTSRTPGTEHGAVGHASAEPTSTAAAPPTPPKQDASSHVRTGSTSSSGKKQGLFSKIKAKLHHDK